MVLDDEHVLRVDNVYKKFCRNIKYSMVYGSVDLAVDSLGIKRNRTRLRKHEFWAVNGMNMSLKKGEVLGVIGLNGSGKTTLMRLISGIYPVDEGRIEVRGKVSSLFAVTAGMHPLFSGRENIFLKGTMFGMSKQEIDNKLDDIIAFSELETFIDAPLGTYSSGMRARLGFSIAVFTEPDLLIIDEGLAVGDVAFRQKCFRKVRELGERMAVIFISHNIFQVSQVSSRIVVLQEGKNIHETDSVSGGIDFYVRKFVRKSEGKVENSKLAYIKSVEVRNGAEQEASDAVEVPYMGELLVDMEYELSPEVADAEVIVKIHNQAQDFIAESRSGLFGFKPKNDGETQKVRIRFDRMELTPGVYALSLVINDKKDNFSIAQANFVADFQVTGYFTSKAISHLSTQWQPL